MKPLDAPKIPSGRDEDEIDFTGYVDFLVEARWFILLSAFVVTLLGTAYAFLARPIYRADLLIQVEEAPGTTKSLLGDLSSLFDIKTEATTEIEILRSRMVVSRAVDTLKLYITAKPRYFPIIGAFIASRNNGLSSPGLAGFGGYAWGSERIVLDRFDVPAELYTERFDLTYLGNGNYRVRSPDGDHTFEGHVGRPQTFALPEGTVKLTVSTIEAKPGIRFRLIRDSTLETVQNLQERLDIAEKTKQSGVIEASYEGDHPERCRAVLHEIGKEYVIQNVQRKAAEAEKSLAFLESQLPDLKAQLELAEEKYTRFRNEHGTLDLSAEAQQMLQQAADSQARLLALRVQKEDLMQRFGAEHPSVRSIEQQMQVLNASVDQYDREMRRLPDIERQAVGLMRDVQVDTDLYTGLLSNTEQLRLIKAGKVGSVRLVDDAQVPELPVRPRRVLVIALSFVIGLVSGAVLALVRNTLFSGITEPHEIEQHAGLNVFASIPYSEAQQRLAAHSHRHGSPARLLLQDKPHEPAIESLRSLRTALQFALLDASSNIVMLTGATPGVGKSFISANFAGVLAAGGKRVLLIDADLHKGRLHEYLGTTRDLGLSELIAGILGVDDVIRRNVGPGIDFIPMGKHAPNASELIVSASLRARLEALAQLYDVVIVDTPPVLAISDAEVLGACAGAVFLVVRYEVTRLGEVFESSKRLAQAGVPIKGALFNGIRLNRSRTGYGSKYGPYRYTHYGYYAQGRDKKG